MTDTGKEIELKLLLPAGTRGLLRHPRLAGVRASRQSLHTIYFDTRSFKLAEQGVALRVRRVGRHWIQTLKTEGRSSGGLSSRLELETPVSGPAIEFERFPEEAGRHVPASLRNKLLPVFETRFNRRSWVVTGNWGSQIEVALDEGEIQAGGKTEPLCELELELKSGRPDALFALALELAGSVPLWPFDRSKAERGARLARGVALSPVKAVFPELDRHMPLAGAWQAIASQCLRQLGANLPGIGPEADPEYLHQARVALRRFFSAHALFKNRLAVPLAMMGELRKFNGVLGAARDWDVFCTQTLPPLQVAMPDNAPLQHLARRAEQARRQAHVQVADYLQSPRCGKLLLGLARRLTMPRRQQANGPEADRLKDFAGRRLKKRHRQVRAITGHPVAGVEQRHQLRIRIKRLRYALDCFSSLYPGKALMPMTQALAVLQDILGHMNDRAVADTLMASLREESAEFQRARDLVDGWLAARGAESEGSLEAAQEQFSGIRRTAW